MIASSLELRLLTLDELLSDDYAAIDEPEEQRIRQAREQILRWCNICADDNWEAFSRRLKLSSLTIEGIQARLSGVDRRPSCSEPGWVSDCRLVLERVSQTSVPIPVNATRWAFGPLLESLVSQTVMDLAKKTCFFNESIISQSCRESIIQSLWFQIEDRCGTVLFSRFKQWRDAVQIDDKTEFDDFVKHMRNQGFKALFVEYPATIRLIATTCRNWVLTLSKLLVQFENDRSSFHTLNESIGRDSILTDIKLYLSDLHNGGQSVASLVLDKSQRLIYKPRNLSSDKIVGDFLSYLRLLGYNHDLIIPKHLTYDDHGWSEFIEIEDCSHIEEIACYYQRAGAWLAIFYILGATDIHAENIRASGQIPVPTDLETLFHKYVDRSEQSQDDASACAANFIHESILSVGLLPLRTKTGVGVVSDIGGLDPLFVATKKIEWVNINTVAMQPHLKKENYTTTPSLPSLGGATAFLKDHKLSFNAGFERVLNFSSQEKSAIIHFFQQREIDRVPVRRVYRPTRFYGLIIQRLKDFRNMKNTVDWSMQTEIIGRAINWNSVGDSVIRQFAQERKSLVYLDIPVFNTNDFIESVETDLAFTVDDPNSSDCSCGSWNIEQRLSDSSLAAQKMILTACLGIKSGPSFPVGYNTQAVTTDVEHDLPIAVERHLNAKAFRGSRSASWILFEYHDSYGMGHPILPGQGLYNGLVGIAVFYAALGRTRNSFSAKAMSLACCDQLRAAVRSPSRAALQKAIGIGGGNGLGSLIYGLAVCGQLTIDEYYFELALACADLMTEQAITADITYDTMSGAAGACLSLIKLYELTGKSHLLDKAVQCAVHLINSRHNQTRMWSSSTFNQIPLTGISHGAAGYALAFSRLYSKTGDKRFHRALNDCIAFEDSYFDANQGNWADPRQTRNGDAQWWPLQWCYGAVGITYSRMAMAKDQTVCRSQVEFYVRSTVKLIEENMNYKCDSLCCGTAGRIDFLLAASTFLEDDRVLRLAQTMLSKLSSRFMHRSTMWNLGNDDFNLGLFRGAAGIGYVGLRMEDPSIPQVLVWQ